MPRSKFPNLSQTSMGIIDTHLSHARDEETGVIADGARVLQRENASSVYHSTTGRLWLHNHTSRRQTYREHNYYSRQSVSGALVCSHPLKLWDLRRHLLPREAARVQGFPDAFRLPRTRFHRLLANAVAVPCAAHALSRVVGADEEGVTHIDLCAGIGGFSVACKRVNPKATTIGYSEVLPYAKECYEDNFPGVQDLGDATVLTTEWPSCTLLTAGFPCQPFSGANSRDKRKGHTHRRFYETVLDAVDRTHAQRVVFENVSNLVTTGNEEWEALLRGLAERGFETHHSILNALDFGLPQDRKRVYLVGRRDPSLLAPPPPPPVLPRACLGDVLLPD